MRGLIQQLTLVLTTQFLAIGRQLLQNLDIGLEFMVIYLVYILPDGVSGTVTL
ncbi:MAG: hypothetical protein IPH24_13660 [Crocinitomicaceae bacterium]|nr:hypothetical protein [Crocinitomicaceae bacterium]